MFRTLEKLSGFIAFLCLILGFPIETLQSEISDWKIYTGFRHASLKVKVDGSGNEEGFALMDGKITGIDFTNLLAQKRSLRNQLLLNGSGVAAGDIDGDGRCDLFFCGLDSPNRLYRNLGGWKFEEIGGSAGVACPGMDCTGAILADFNGDGRLDLVVNRFSGRSFLFLNQGKGAFRDASEEFGFMDAEGSMSATAGDFDGDGYLDLYVANYRSGSIMDLPNTELTLKNVGGRNIVTHMDGRRISAEESRARFTISASGGVIEHGEADHLYRNEAGKRWNRLPFHNGRFRNENQESLEKAPNDWGLSAVFRDINQDGAPDLYVCNDFDSPDRLWINDGTGRFSAVPKTRIRQLSWFSMGVDFADINRDGLDDFFVLDMLSRDHQLRMNQSGILKRRIPVIGITDNRPQYVKNSFYLNRGHGFYSETAFYSGLQASEWAWATAFMDVHLDGYQDLLITNGNERDGRNIDITSQLKRMRITRQMKRREILEARVAFPSLKTKNLAFRNRGDLTFEEAGAKWNFQAATISHGLALADLDNDGDLDIAVNNLNSPAGIYQNLSKRPRIAVRLKGRAPNRFGIGARIVLKHSEEKEQSREMTSGGRYLSSDQPIRVFAYPFESGKTTLEVRWRSGRVSTVTDVSPNRIYEIDEEASPALPMKLEKTAPIPVRALFKDISATLSHIHRQASFDDYSRQPLLPYQLSRLGPGITWHDLNDDGREDLLISGGRGDRSGAFQNEGQGRFSPINSPPFHLKNRLEQTSLLIVRAPDDSKMLLSGFSNYVTAAGPLMGSYNLDHQKFLGELPQSDSATGPMALSDIDGDGDLDLFLGGRVIPGRWPEPASSKLYRNRNGKWFEDEDSKRVFQHTGLVSGALFTDLNNDGFAELVLATEWGPLRIFENRKGHFQDKTEEYGMNGFRGWWTAVTAGDFDGDGRMDLAASNWGRNTRYQEYRDRPLRIYYGPVNSSGTLQIVEAYEDPVSGEFLPIRQMGKLVKGIPDLVLRLKTNAAFGSADIKRILGAEHDAYEFHSAEWLESTVFLNRNHRFDAILLPMEVQLSPAFGITAADWNGDGDQDLFIAQNFSASQPWTPRNDAGFGALLIGNGKGEFQAMSAEESGIRIFGDMRGAASCDFNQDGKMDLAVAQNGGETKLFQNLSLHDGIRIRLKGPPQNPHGFGASIRIKEDDQFGPATEIHAGSGYWSQDSPIPVLFPSSRKSKKQLDVRWPGGTVTRVEFTGLPRELKVSISGSL